MKIVYLHQYFNTPAMSGGTRSYEMARRLVKWGHEVHMVTTRRDGAGQEGWTTTVEDGIQVHWLSLPYANTMGYARRIGAFFRFAAASAAKAASLGGDVVFATSTPLTIALPGVYASRKNRIPMVFEVRDLWPTAPIAIGALKNPGAIAAARWLEQFAYRNSARIVALSPDMGEGVAAAGYPREKITMIPNSSDLELFDVGPEPGRAFRARYDWLGDRPLVVYTGTLGRVNGAAYLARLAAQVASRDPEIRFLIVGEGIEEKLVREEAWRLGVLDQSFFMLPSMPKSEMPVVLSAASLTTSTVIDVKELWPNSANKFFDSLAAGKPIAINHGGWQADNIRATGCGLVLDPHDVEGAADQVVKALRDPAWLEAAGVAAKKLAVEQFSREDLARQLEAVLLEAVERT